MGLQIAERKAGVVTILDLVGRIVIGVSNDTLVAELRKYSDAGASEVVLNLAGVSYVDSAGLGEERSITLAQKVERGLA